MEKKFIMGNEAIGLGAIRAGVRLVSGYPGTPSTEVLETVAKHNPGDIFVEWSANEKAALEVAAGGAYTGARTMVTMKQVGLNVATDPLMSLSYIGVKGGMVVMVADDPGPISSQTEQDTRTFAAYSKLPVVDPASPEEAYQMIQDAFDYSETYHTPVLFRPTTRVCHGCASIELEERPALSPLEGFVKDAGKWVIFPRLSYQNHQKICQSRIPELSKAFSDYRFNTLKMERAQKSDGQCTNGHNTKEQGTEGQDADRTDTGNLTMKKGIIAGGISYEYACESLQNFDGVRVLRVATPYPFPEELALKFLDGLTEVLVLEELDPVLEEALIHVCGTHHLSTKIYGKLSGHTACAGENTVESVRRDLEMFLGVQLGEHPLPENLPAQQFAPTPDMPVRPPVLCAGCSHRASFYAVKRAMEGREAVFCGDIGCYTLGNAKPLDMVDTCLCMGAGITLAQGMSHMEPDKTYFAFAGDSTFFASGIAGIVNAVYNQANMIVVILDNSTTAMTGHQPHPGTGRTMMGQVVDKINIPEVLKGIGVKEVATVNPLELQKAIDTVRDMADKKGVKAIIFKYPCIALSKKPDAVCFVNEDKCVLCEQCISEIGCPALVKRQGKIFIDASLCTGCGLCTQVCSVGAIEKKEG